MIKAVDALEGYAKVRIDGLISHLRRNSPENGREFIITPKPYAKPATNPFNWFATGTNILDRRTFQIAQIVPNPGLLASVFGMSEESENLIATVYAERGTADYKEDWADFSVAYDYLKIKFPGEVGFPSGSRIPASTIELQAETDCHKKISLERRDLIRVFRMFWLRTNLDETLPDSLFLDPNVKYSRV